MTPMQKPIGSGYDAYTTAVEVIAGHDLSGKIAMVTGGYSGLGLETTRQLTRAGATVIVPARTREKADAALKGIDGVESEMLDLADPTSIRGLSDRFLSSGRKLSILINSAGIMAPPLGRDARGYELQFATNHLGHFQLTQALWPALAAAEGARVVSVSSRGHFFAGVDFDDPHFENRPYDAFVAYGQSKTANALFAVELDRRGQAEGIRAFSLHPGAILTDLARHMSPEIIRQYGAVDDEGAPVIDPAQDKKSIAQGAATQIWCAVSPQLNGLGGLYCEDSDVAVPTPAESGLLRGVKPWATDPELAERLWDLSQHMISR